MLIRIYDGKTLEVKCVLTKVISMQWERYFYDLGNFEFVCSAADPRIKYIQTGNIITHADNSGIILYRGQKDSVVTVRGYDLKFFCRARMIVPPFMYMNTPIDTIYGYDRIKGSAETVIKHYIDTQLINPTDTERKIKFLTVAANKNRGDSMAWQAKFTTVNEELKKIAQYSKLGYDITFDPENKKFVFDVLKGTDRTTAQTAVSPVIFCREYKNISESEYEQDWLNAVNAAYVGGNGEDEEQYVQELKSDSCDTDFLRIEGYTSVSSDDVDEVDDGGYAYISENEPTEHVKASANSRYKYKKDWFIGDYITARTNAFGEILTVNQQIIGAKEVFERCNSYVTPIFNTEDNILKKLKG